MALTNFKKQLRSDLNLQIVFQMFNLPESNIWLEPLDKG